MKYNNKLMRFDECMLIHKMIMFRTNNFKTKNESDNNWLFLLQDFLAILQKHSFYKYYRFIKYFCVPIGELYC